jgi:hypothetical protein
MGLADVAVKAAGEVQETPAGLEVKVTVPSNIAARVRIAVTEEPGVLLGGLKLKLVMEGRCAGQGVNQAGNSRQYKVRLLVGEDGVLGGGVCVWGGGGDSR